MKIALVLATLCVSSTLAFQQPPPPPRPPGLPNWVKAKADQIPFLKEDSTDPQQQSQREARAGIFRIGARRLPLDQRQDFYNFVQVDRAALPELPLDEETTTIVYGSIIDKNTFVTKNKCGLYTEFTLKVDRMLRPVDKLISEENISIIHWGGLAKSPAGGILFRKCYTMVHCLKSALNTSSS